MTLPIADFASLPTEFSLRLVLIRHGEPEQAAKGRCYGRLDVCLSEAGRKQIEKKIAAIRSLTAEALYTSPLKRARESAAIIAASLGIEATLSSELNEIHFGAFEGLTYEEVERLYPEEYRLWMEHPTEIRFPQGESFAEVKTRVLRFKDFVLNVHAGETVVAVSHGGANRILLADALAIPDPMIFRIDQAYAALNVIDYLKGSPLVRIMNG
jgi:alpha-ribazole phosphatase/probable phosphoglycerate mutase